MFKKIKRLLFFMLILLIILSSIFIKKGYDLYASTISKTPLDKKISSVRSNTSYVELSKVSKDFTDAILAIEDHRFYEHGPVDIVAILRSIVTDIKKNSLASGGSTLSQQLAKNLYFSQEKNFTRKIAEIFVAYDLEKNYEKDEILELYINTVYFGDGYTGIKEASIGYLDKDPIDLTFYESTLLAGLPNAPSVYALSNNSKLTYERQEQVIDAMVKYGYVSSNDLRIKIDK